MVNKATTTTNKNRLLPVWLMRVIGISSLATAVIGFAIYWFKKYPPRRKIAKGDSSSSSSSSRAIDESSTTTNNSQHEAISLQESIESWSSKILNKVRKNKKKMTISLKNTVLWNPSPDVDIPIYAFQENSIQILNRLTYMYDVYLIIHINSEQEKEYFSNLLKENVTSVDTRKIIYCSEEEGKIHIIRHIEPFVHIEGGWEKDDGEEIIKKLKPFIKKLIWIITKRKRNSFQPQHIKKQDLDLLSKNIELSDLLTNTSIAHEVKDL